VAFSAILRKVRRHVVRIRGATVIVQMAGDASTRKTGINTILVACGARQTRMGTIQRELCRMIECRPQPGSCIVARRALLRETTLRMTRVRRAVVVCQMTGNTGRRNAGIDIVFMACGARPSCVGTVQTEGGEVVIEFPPSPAGLCMAACAIRRESPIGMDWIFRSIKIRGVTRITGHRHPGIFSVGVTLLTLNRFMGAGQREFCGSAVVEAGKRPSSSRVAGKATPRKPCGNMVRTDC